METISPGNTPRCGEGGNAIELISSQPWAIQPEMLETIVSVARRENETPEAVAARLGRPLQNARTVTARNGVAVVPVVGPIFRYANLFTEVSGATSLEVLARDFSTAVADQSISAVVLDINSPGGQASGIAEFAHMVSKAGKRVVAYVVGTGASAAYWIAAAADELVIGKTGEVGSIGAVLGVYRQSGPTDVVDFVSSQSPMKRPDPDTDAGRSELQRRVDALAQVFIEDVAQHRHVSAETVQNDFGKGGVRLGEEAVRLGMADRVSTLEDVIAGLAGKIGGIDMPYSSTNNTPTPNGSITAEPGTPEYFEQLGEQVMSAKTSRQAKPGKQLVNDAAARSEWEKDTGLQGEFGNDFAVFMAYKKAVASGRVKHHGRAVRR